MLRFPNTALLISSLEFYHTTLSVGTLVKFTLCAKRFWLAKLPQDIHHGDTQQQ
jgi:hypothetical protein